jgi:predicted transcriptional regulator
MEDSKTGQSLVDSLLGSDVKAQLLVLFRRNPGLIDEMEGIGRRVGRRKESLEAAMKELVEIGVVEQRRIGGTAVYSLNGRKDAEIQREVGNYLMKSQGMTK